MILVPPSIREALFANASARQDALASGVREPDPIPVVRFFNPVGSGTWLATEIDADDILFGLADLGFGSPELGSFSLADLEAVRLPFGLGIERDIAFVGRFPLSVYAEAAREAGSLLVAERFLHLRGREPVLRQGTRGKGAFGLRDGLKSRERVSRRSVTEK